MNDCYPVSKLGRLGNFVKVVYHSLVQSSFIFRFVVQLGNLGQCHFYQILKCAYSSYVNVKHILEHWPLKQFGTMFAITKKRTYVF